jgi:hypothetical protein
VSSVLVAVIQALVILSLGVLERGRWLPGGEATQENQAAP